MGNLGIFRVLKVGEISARVIELEVAQNRLIGRIVLEPLAIECCLMPGGETQTAKLHSTLCL